MDPQERARRKNEVFLIVYGRFDDPRRQHARDYINGVRDDPPATWADNLHLRLEGLRSALESAEQSRTRLIAQREQIENDIARQDEHIAGIKHDIEDVRNGLSRLAGE